MGNFTCHCASPDEEAGISSGGDDRLSSSTPRRSNSTHSSGDGTGSQGKNHSSHQQQHQQPQQPGGAKPRRILPTTGVADVTIALDDDELDAQMGSLGVHRSPVSEQGNNVGKKPSPMYYGSQVQPCLANNCGLDSPQGLAALTLNPTNGFTNLLHQPLPRRSPPNLAQKAMGNNVYSNSCSPVLTFNPAVKRHNKQRSLRASIGESHVFAAIEKEQAAAAAAAASNANGESKTATPMASPPTIQRMSSGVSDLNSLSPRGGVSGQLSGGSSFSSSSPQQTGGRKILTIDLDSTRMQTSNGGNNGGSGSSSIGGSELSSPVPTPSHAPPHLTVSAFKKAYAAKISTKVAQAPEGGSTTAGASFKNDMQSPPPTGQPMPQIQPPSMTQTNASSAVVFVVPSATTMSVSEPIPIKRARSGSLPVFTPISGSPNGENGSGPLTPNNQAKLIARLTPRHRASGSTATSTVFDRADLAPYMTPENILSEDTHLFHEAYKQWFREEIAREDAIKRSLPAHHSPSRSLFSTPNLQPAFNTFMAADNMNPLEIDTLSPPYDAGLMVDHATLVNGDRSGVASGSATPSGCRTPGGGFTIFHMMKEVNSRNNSGANTPTHAMISRTKSNDEYPSSPVIGGAACGGSVISRSTTNTPTRPTQRTLSVTQTPRASPPRGRRLSITMAPTSPSVPMTPSGALATNTSEKTIVAQS